MSGTCVTEPHVLCDTCGTTVITPLEETHTCSYCGETFYDDTPPTCLSCGYTCCQECEQNYLVFCNECALNVCIECTNYCARCDEPVCDECKNVCDVCYNAYCKQCWQAHEADYFMFEREDIISVNYFDFDSELTLALAQWYDCDPFYVAKHIRSGYNDQQSNNIYYVTGVGYDCISSDLLGKESNKEAYAQFIEQYDIIL